MISRIILGCYNNSDFDRIVLDKRTRPFAIAGSSEKSSTAACPRDGDYDFASIEMIELLYVSRNYPGSLSKEVYTLLRDKMLTIRGAVVSTIYQTSCNFVVGPIQKDVVLDIGETENHILMMEISRYLTNQLLIEVYPDNLSYNNTMSGNTKWLLEHLSNFTRDYFFEYNSRPYQVFTVKALTVLHSYALDSDLVLATEIVLDMITAYSSIQMNRLRRFPPFRRQPKYTNRTQSWDGDGEFYRLAVLVGDYDTLQGPNYTMPTLPEFGPTLGDVTLPNAVATKYRLTTLLDMFFLSENQTSYFAGHNYVAEMYYSTSTFLISAGGNGVDATIPPFSFADEYCLFDICILKNKYVRAVLEYFYLLQDTDSRGWSEPTSIIPTYERSMDQLDLVRFDGNRDFKQNCSKS
jgi:hypothetical protein